jgi:HEAT repeat-containing protein 5
MVMYPLPGGDWMASEIESVVSLCIKSLDTADQITRHSLAQLVGLVLSSSQAPVITPTPDLTKKNKKEKEEDDSAPTSTPTGETKTILALNDMFQQLSVHLNKPQTTHKARVGIFDLYAALFTALGPAFVEANYGTIIQHLMSEIVNSPRNAATRYDVLFIRRLIGILLRDLIGVRMLSEQYQIAAIQELSKVYLKRWPALMPGSIAPTAHVLTIVLREVAGLLQQLGNAPPPVQVRELASKNLNTLSPCYITGGPRRTSCHASCPSKPHCARLCCVGPAHLLFLRATASSQDFDPCRRAPSARHQLPR